MTNKEVVKEVVDFKGQADMDETFETGEVTSQLNDSIGLSRQELRESEEEELTPS